ncbi:MAG: hypothetical protein U5R31_05700 [Acidimicrobiia bacterium]|nr:hypothetical protein [Acidimicrobiia bacterium]
MLFAKSSDRPPGEAQVVEAHPRRPAGGTLATQYLEIDDAGAHAVMGSRPAWLWGFEHGVNEHGLAMRATSTSTPSPTPTGPPTRSSGWTSSGSAWSGPGPPARRSTS